MIDTGGDPAQQGRDESTGFDGHDDYKIADFKLFLDVYMAGGLGTDKLVALWWQVNMLSHHWTNDIPHTETREIQQRVRIPSTLESLL